MRKKDKQKFYQIPFGKLLNLIEVKAIAAGISVVVIDEAYTSKTSCLSANALKNQQKKDKGETFLSTDFNGSRVKGRFRDRVFKVDFHSDINGAVNHIVIALSKIKTNLVENLNKICSPLKFKSANEFSDYLRAYLA